jgi:hydrogenase nickel insertion protein HypA
LPRAVETQTNRLPAADIKMAYGGQPWGDTTMRFMLIMRPGEKAETGALPDTAIIAAMMKYNQELHAAGLLRALEGLHPSSKGARALFRGGKPVVTSGPLTGAKDLVGGFWLIRVPQRKGTMTQPGWASGRLFPSGHRARVRPDSPSRLGFGANQRSEGMHELSVAADLLDLVLKTARENGATTVLTARIRIGAGSCLNPESLAFGFEALAAGTSASGCQLEIEHLAAPVSCTACGWAGERMDVAELECPDCHTSPLRITGGRELTVDSITVE